jgi:uncharacterized SAM-binding protein YcdF (DUF218 family)
MSGSPIFASLFGDLAQPLAILWLLCLASTFGAFRRKQWRSAFALLFVSIVFFVIGATPTSGLLAQRLEAPYVISDWDAVPNADAIVVLGAALGRSTADLNGFNLKRETDRIITAFELARREKAKALVLGGGKGTPSEGFKSEGEHMQHWFETWKVASVPTYVLPGNLNTHDEALGTKELINEQEWESVLLVTSGTHMARAEAVFRAAGVEVIPVACDFEGSSYLERTGGWSIVPRQSSFYLMKVYLHEVIGWPYYRLRGWIVDPRPLIGW